MSNAVFEDALIEARIDEIKTTRDHGFAVNDTEAGEYLAAPMALTSTAEDRAIIYHRETGEPREVLVNMLAKTLKKKNPDGSRVFDTAPTKEYKQGSVPCWFNPASERYADIREIPGLENFKCDAAHLASEFDAELHAKNRHDRRYLRVKDYLDRKEREDDRKRQDRQIEAMMAMAGAKAEATTIGPTIHACPIDTCTRFFDSAQGLTLHQNKEHRE